MQVVFSALESRGRVAQVVLFAVCWWQTQVRSTFPTNMKALWGGTYVSGVSGDFCGYSVCVGVWVAGW